MRRLQKENATGDGNRSRSIRFIRNPRQTLRRAVAAVKIMKDKKPAVQADIPNWVQWVENPRYLLREGIEIFRGIVIRLNFEFFPGAAGLIEHDAHHGALLRGLGNNHDEACVIAICMASTGRSRRWQAWLFTVVARLLYPGEYKFDRSSASLFMYYWKVGLKLREHGCHSLSEICFADLMDKTLEEVWAEVGISEKVLKEAYQHELHLYPQHEASDGLRRRFHFDVPPEVQPR